jgi:hypothetical protein
MGGEEVDAVGIGHEGPRPVDEFGDHLADRQPETRAQHRGDRGAAPVGEATAVGGEEDDREGGDEQRLGGVDVEGEGILDRVVVEEEVVQRVQDAPVDVANCSQLP